MNWPPCCPMSIFAFVLFSRIQLIMSLTKIWSLIAVLVIAAVAPRGAFAQAGETTVTCLSSFDWMNNSLSQNPCLVGSYLASECVNETLGLGPLGPGDNYYFDLDNANDCLCSTVTYSMFGACTTCQNNTVENWSVWSTGCSTSLTHYSVYPLNIPNGTAIPHWAYLDVVTNDMFNAAAAQRDGDPPESTSTQVQSTISIISSTTSISASLTSSSTTQSPTSTLKSSSVGAIAGGIIGGVIAGIAIASVVAWFFVRHRRSTKASPAAFSDISGGPGCTQSVYMTQQLPLYDPSDPRTFPTSSPSGAILTTSSATDNVYKGPTMPSYDDARQSRSSWYSGAPEV
ncbi:hypothetical protein K503DRAFT_868752 [Rhizopogon vinicolor AM-OR11-026]|uniref:Uncharacterized protein n=1 Tax=Rhizopogon vinicolor AM-OR11-026 TaxID=1314800 RepID=A0A1B7MQ45_9AGAM|nr:hypothetical protein K503DRAFT_868752 [Rhizopogon vinicolor AM-OR11-026]